MALKTNALYEAQLEALIATAQGAPVTPDSHAFYAAMVKVMLTMFTDAQVSVTVPALGLISAGPGGAVTGAAVGSGTIG